MNQEEVKKLKVLSAKIRLNILKMLEKKRVWSFGRVIIHCRVYECFIWEAITL